MSVVSNAKDQDPYRTTFHRDRSATIWNVFQQQWVRYYKIPGDGVMASLNVKERERVTRHIARGAS